MERRTKIDAEQLISAIAKSGVRESSSFALRQLYALKFAPVVRLSRSDDHKSTKKIISLHWNNLGRFGTGADGPAAAMLVCVENDSGM
jgi:hypothetical protein